MFKNLLILTALTIVFLFCNKPVFALVEPGITQNNYFGIHIIDENDLELASQLVNSSGGEWGYITIVLREDDRKIDKWQSIFDRMRELKLIPIIRLATKFENENWIKPREDDIKPWVDFLSSLNWVVKNRYIVLFNEPNHANEWGGEVRPEEYAKFLRLFYEALKKKSEDFFILPAGLDASSPNSETSMNIFSFYDKMYLYDAEIFSLYDGLATHAYPNPNFSGFPNDSSRTGITSYLWEINHLSKLGLANDLPVFITESGWQHKEGIEDDYSFHSAEKVAQFYEEAYTNIWKDKRIIAATPFILRYLEEPFDHFSWIKFDSQEFYPQYESIKSIKKTKGQPLQEKSAEIISQPLPTKLVIDSDYEFTVSFKNTGQSIWNEDDYHLQTNSSLPEKDLIVGKVPRTLPYNKADISVKIRTPDIPGLHNLKQRLEYQGELFANEIKSVFKLVPPPNLSVHAIIWLNNNSNAEDLTLLIYDGGNLIKKFSPFSLTSGTGRIDKLFDIIPQKEYRFVLLKPNFLPRQEIAVLNENKTTISFKRLLPIDFDGDGTLTTKDFIHAMIHPIKTMRLLFSFH